MPTFHASSPTLCPSRFQVTSEGKWKWEQLCAAAVWCSLTDRAAALWIALDRQDLNTPSLWIFVPVLIPCNIPGGDTEHDCNDDDVISFIVIINKTISSISSAVLLLWWWGLAVIGGTAAWDGQWLRRCKTGARTLWLWGCTYQILNF